MTSLVTDLHTQTGTCSKTNYKQGDYLGVSRKQAGFTHGNKDGD